MNKGFVSFLKKMRLLPARSEPSDGSSIEPLAYGSAKADPDCLAGDETA